MRQKALEIAEKKSHEQNTIISFYSFYLVLIVCAMDFMLKLILNENSILYKEKIVELSFFIVSLCLLGGLIAIDSIIKEIKNHLEAKNYSRVKLYYELKELSCSELKYAASPFSYSVYRSKMNKLPYESRYKVLSYYYKLGKQRTRTEVKKVFDANPYTLNPSLF